MRADLLRILDETLGLQGLSPSRLDVADLGDGYRLHLPASISPRSALDPFVVNLATALRLHREASSEANRLRLRVVIHSGLLHPQPGGAWAGEPLKACARLLDAPAGRQILDALPAADLVVIASRTIYDSVVRHGYTMDPALFRRILIEVKETEDVAWACVPGADPSWEAPRLPASVPRQSPPVVGPHRPSGVSINGGHIVINSPVVGGNFYGGYRDVR